MGNYPQTQNFEFFQKWATDPKWAQIWGVLFCTPTFFNFGPGGIAHRPTQARHLLLMTIVGCQPLTANTLEQKNTLFAVQMKMLHPSDAILISLYSISTHIKVSVVCDGKTKINCILFEPSCSRYRIAVISKAYKGPNCWVLS